jgi:hypothetical protein
MSYYVRRGGVGWQQCMAMHAVAIFPLISTSVANQPDHRQVKSSSGSASGAATSTEIVCGRLSRSTGHARRRVHPEIAASKHDSAKRNAHDCSSCEQHQSFVRVASRPSSSCVCCCQGGDRASHDFKQPKVAVKSYKPQTATVSVVARAATHV